MNWRILGFENISNFECTQEHGIFIEENRQGANQQKHRKRAQEKSTMGKTVLWFGQTRGTVLLY